MEGGDVSARVDAGRCRDVLADAARLVELLPRWICSPPGSLGASSMRWTMLPWDVRERAVREAGVIVRAARREVAGR
ncbi:hypothetical protein [Streptomyces sp. NPDC001250]|uniref:hypothetical protein n=1 Tax=unclassified Streptomyces TaxID=2593676 RepID=UPI00333299D2